MIYNLSLADDIKNQFTNTIPTEDLLLSLLVACVSAFIINFIYKKSFLGVNYTKSFSLSIILLSLVTSIVIRTINSNLSLSLGMVGALSIVRFRTSVKDPVDTIFMFWAITVGIMSGAGLYIITILSTLIIGLIYFLCFIMQAQKDTKKLLIINVNSSYSDIVIEMINKKKCNIKTESYRNTTAELTIEAKNRKQVEELIKLKDKPEIVSLNIIDID
jgi:hypothetical protein